MIHHALFHVQPQQERASTSSSTEQAAAGTSTATSSGPTAEELKQKVFESVKTGFESVKTKFEQASSSDNSGSSSESSSSSSSESQKASLLQSISKEIKECLLPSDDIVSVTRMYTGPVADASQEGYEGPAALMVVKQQQTTWQKMREKVSSSCS